jgi:serine/threonine protein kinase
MDLEVMNSFQARFQKLEKIGSGTYGVVYKIQDRQTKQIFALKKIKIEFECNGIPPTALREIVVLKNLKHQNIVNLLDIFLVTTKLYLIFEYLDYDLKRYIDRSQISLSTIKDFMRQLLEGLLFCHERRVIHRDLKPQNLLVSESNILKIADFGLSRAFSIPLFTLTHEVVTLWYRAPEVLLGATRYTFSIDIWSVGCIFAEMAEKRPLFQGDSEIDQLFRIFKVLGTPTREENPELVKLPDFKESFPRWSGDRIEDMVPRLGREGQDLIRKMLCLNPEERITARDALRHSYFQ